MTEIDATCLLGGSPNSATENQPLNTKFSWHDLSVLEATAHP